MSDNKLHQILIVLAGIPMGKQRIRVTRDGHAYTPERTVTFESRLAYAAQQAMGSRPLLEGALICDICIVMPIPASKPRAWREAALRCEIRPTRKPDWDNLGKCVDALNMIVWPDDAHIVRGVVDKFYGERPMFAIRVRSATPDQIPQWAIDALNDRGVFA